MSTMGQIRNRTLWGVSLAALMGLGAGCATWTSQNIAETRAAWEKTTTAEISRNISTEKPLALDGWQLAPPVAYEWLAESYLEEGMTDDAVLALLMSSVLYRDSTGNSALVSAVYEEALLWRGNAAMQAALAALGKPGQGRTEISKQELLRVVENNSQAGLQCRDANLVAGVTQALRKYLTPKNAADGKKYLEGNLVDESALGLAMLQRREDWPYIERVVASAPYQSMLHPYLRAIAKGDPDMESRLLNHPSGMVRANALIALGKPALEREKDSLVLVAGAFNPKKGEREQAIRTLEQGLTDERHAVRVMAIYGLAQQGVQVPCDKIRQAILTSNEWLEKYYPAARDKSLSFIGGSWTKTDTHLTQLGYELLACQAALSKSDYAWALSQMRSDPSFLQEVLSFGIAAAEVGGYPTEYAYAVPGDTLNNKLANALGKHAPQHPELLLSAIQTSSPYARMFLLQAASNVATNAAIRSELWQMAERVEMTPAEKEYQRDLTGRMIAELETGLSYNQSINEYAVRGSVEGVMKRVHEQNRRIAVGAIASAANTAEVARLVRLLPDPQVARALVPILLAQGKDAIGKQVPVELLKNKEREVRLAAAILRLYAADEPAAREVLLATLRGNVDAVEFAARVALATKSSPLREVVLGAEKVPAMSLAGHLVRRVEQQVRQEKKIGVSGGAGERRPE